MRNLYRVKQLEQRVGIYKESFAVFEMNHFGDPHEEEAVKKHLLECYERETGRKAGMNVFIYEIPAVMEGKICGRWLH
jgi:DNA-directed RNA polymerase subunit E'/Rpb7